MAKHEAGQISISVKSQVVLNRAGKRVRRRNAKEPSCWFWSPGNVFLLKEGERLITSIGIDGQPVNQVDYVRAAWQKGTKIVFLFPTDRTDPDAIEVTRSGKRVNINLSDEMTEWGIPLSVNTRSRFRMVLCTPDDAVYPAVKIDTGVAIDIKTIKSTKSKSEPSGPSDETAAGQVDPIEVEMPEE